MTLRIRPPILALGFLGFAYILHRAYPVDPLLPEVVKPAALLFLLLGLALSRWALHAFKMKETTYQPFGRPTALASVGPFRYSRNPMYMAVTIVLLGAFAWVRTPIMLLPPLLFGLTMHLVQVPREERLLADLFGDSYREYCRRVRRWM